MRELAEAVQRTACALHGKGRGARAYDLRDFSHTRHADVCSRHRFEHAASVLGEALGLSTSLYYAHMGPLKVRAVMELNASSATHHGVRGFPGGVDDLGVAPTDRLEHDPATQEQLVRKRHTVLLNLGHWPLGWPGGRPWPLSQYRERVGSLAKWLASLRTHHGTQAGLTRIERRRRRPSDS